MSTIDITATGLAQGIRPGYDEFGAYTLGGFSNKPYTAHFLFDTASGLLSDHRLDDGFISAYIDLENLGVWDGNFLREYINVVMWNDDLSYVEVNVGYSYIHLHMTTEPTSGRYGSFQFGNCPATDGGPCGTLQSIDSLTVIGLPLAVPAPLVGSGISSLLVALCVMYVLARRWRNLMG